MALPRDISTSGPRPKTIADQQEIGELRTAFGHAMWRNNLVAKVFCYLSVMRAARLIPNNSKALISPPNISVPQDFQASGNNQAAHYLPGFVAIKAPGSQARCLWDLVPDSRARGNLEDMFRATQDLHVSFNRADSAAESRRLTGPPGLKQLFGECCQAVVDRQPPVSRSGEVFIVVDRPMVSRVFRRWAEGSIEAYRHASGRKKALIKRGRPADVRDEPRTDPSKGVFQEWTLEDLKARARDRDRVVLRRKNSVQDFDDQESFLRAYANSTTAEFPLAENIIHQIEHPFSASKRPDWLLP